MAVLLAITAFFWLVSLWGFIAVLRGPGVVRRLSRLVSVLVRLGIALALSSIVILLHFFRTFSSETLVAHVAAKKLGELQFLVTYIPVDDSPPVEAEIAGDQWSVSGGIVKWHPLLTVFGFKSYHCPMRLSGQFADITQQRSHLPSVVALKPFGLDRFWEALYWMDPYLPMVEAVYGSSAYAYLEPAIIQDVYVSNSGYLIKRGKKL